MKNLEILDHGTIIRLKRNDIKYTIHAVKLILKGQRNDWTDRSVNHYFFLSDISLYDAFVEN